MTWPLLPLAHAHVFVSSDLHRRVQWPSHIPQYVGLSFADLAAIGRQLLQTRGACCQWSAQLSFPSHAAVYFGRSAHSSQGLRRQQGETSRDTNAASEKNRGQKVRQFLTERPRGAATNLWLRKTAAGSDPLFPDCYLQWMAQLKRVSTNRQLRNLHQRSAGSSLAASHLACAPGPARKRMNARAASGTAPSDIKAPS